MSMEIMEDQQINVELSTIFSESGESSGNQNPFV